MKKTPRIVRIIVVTIASFILSVFERRRARRRAIIAEQYRSGFLAEYLYGFNRPKIYLDNNENWDIT